MRKLARPDTADRMRAAIGVALIHALFGYALLFGLGVDAPARLHDALKTFDIAPPPPKAERLAPQHHVSRKREGAAAPPALHATATPIVAPKPVIPLPPPPIVAAPTPGRGAEDHQGAAAIAGPGTGSGGFGNGTGSGGAGDGDGDGGESPPRLLRGRLKDSDYPREAGEAGVGGTVSVRYVVEADGRATQCRITRSSGSRALDITTCRLIEERFRFDPSRDAAGRPVPSILVEDHEWVIHDDPPDNRR